jgi:hypothetical protein
VADTAGELEEMMAERNPDRVATKATHAKDLRALEIRIFKNSFLS